MGDLSNTPGRSATGQFLPGRSGNPAGRPLGARNKASMLAEMIDLADSEAIVRAVVDRALAGDWPALRICFTRLVAPKKEAPVQFELPAVSTLAEVAEASAALLAAVAAGEITPGEGQKVMTLLSAQIRILTAAEAAREKSASAPQPRASASPATETAPHPRAAEACISPVPSRAEGPVLAGAVNALEAQPSARDAPAEQPAPCISPVFVAAAAAPLRLPHPARGTPKVSASGWRLFSRHPNAHMARTRAAATHRPLPALVSSGAPVLDRSGACIRPVLRGAPRASAAERTPGARRRVANVRSG